MARMPVSDMHSLMEKVLNSSLNGLYIYDLQEGVTIFINPQYTKITGYTLQDINSLTEPELFALFHPEDHASVLRHVEEINRSADGDILEIEYRFKTADGRWIWCLSWDTVVDRSEDGKALRFLGTFLDITHRKNMEEALRESEERFRSVLENAPGAGYRRNLQTDQYDYMSPVIEQITGYTPEELGTLSVDEVVQYIHPDDRDRVEQEITRTLNGGKGVLEYRFRAKDGSYRWLADTLSVLADKESRPLYRVGIVRDVTDHKQAHEDLEDRSKELKAVNAELQEEKSRLEAVMAALPVGVAITDSSGGIATTNRAYEELWGTLRERARTIQDYHRYKAWWSDTGRVVAPEEWASTVALKRGKAVRGQLLEIQRFDGSQAFVINSAAPVRDKKGDVIGSAVAIQDISELRQTEKALRESQAHFRLLSETAGTLLTSRDPEAVVNEICLKVMRYLDCHLFFNFLVDEKARRLRLNAYGGISEKEARKIEWLDYGAAVCGCVALDHVPIIVEDIQNTSDSRTELVKPFDIQAYACHPILSEDRIIGTLSFGTKTRPSFSDEDLELMKTITDHVATAMERARLIGQLRESRDQMEIRVRERTAELEMKNQELQDFAYIASHDLQEPLRKIVTFGDILVSGSRDALDDEGRDCIDRMQKSAGIMRVLLDSLLSYSRVTTRPAPYMKINLKEPIETALSNLEVTIKEKEALVEVGDLPTIEADPVQMTQLFQNLIGNALKFHSERDIPRVKIYAPTLGKDKSNNKKAQQICIEDNGIGFDETYLDKIFMPFQRLYGKAKFQGVGMGLAICKKIMDRHHGKITAKSIIGKGSTFTVTLPAKQEIRT